MWLNCNQISCSSTYFFFLDKDGAARNGHLAMVKFLDTQRHEGCSVMALTHAARNGHLDIVRYLVALHRRRSDSGSGGGGGCRRDTLSFAAAAGHAHVLRFMLEQGYTFSIGVGNGSSIRRNSSADDKDKLLKFAERNGYCDEVMQVIRDWISSCTHSTNALDAVVDCKMDSPNENTSDAVVTPVDTLLPSVSPSSFAGSAKRKSRSKAAVQVGPGPLGDRIGELNSAVVPAAKETRRKRRTKVFDPTCVDEPAVSLPLTTEQPWLASLSTQDIARYTPLSPSVNSYDDAATPRVWSAPSSPAPSDDMEYSLDSIDTSAYDLYECATLSPTVSCSTGPTGQRAPAWSAFLSQDRPAQSTIPFRTSLTSCSTVATATIQETALCWFCGARFLHQPSDCPHRAKHVEACRLSLETFCMAGLLSKSHMVKLMKLL
jgi:hypothetical protein